MATPIPPLPASVLRYVAQVFGKANRHICSRIAMVPNTAEESLDQALVTFLAGYASPRIVEPGWAVRIDTHFLGGMRHWGRWEIADIGLLVFVKQNSQVVAHKTALLQSKRLYPSAGTVDDETKDDFHLGIHRLIPSKGASTSLSLSHVFEFSTDSAYKAMKVADDQWTAIEDFEDKTNLNVFYLLYNPWALDARYRYPAEHDPAPLGPSANGGCRVVPYGAMRAALDTHSSGYTPKFSDAQKAMRFLTKGHAGWTLEHFVAYEVMKCRKGNLFDGADDPKIVPLFARQAPIAASVSVTIEHFKG